MTLERRMPRGWTCSNTSVAETRNSVLRSKDSRWFQHHCAGTGGVRREALSWRSPIRPRAGNHLGEPATDGGLGIDVSVIVTGMQA